MDHAVPATLDGPADEGLEERLEAELEGRGGEVDVEVLEDVGVEDAEGADDLDAVRGAVVARRGRPPQRDGGRAAREEGGRVDGGDLVARRGGLALFAAEVEVGGLCERRVGDEERRHDAVEEAVDELETRRRRRVRSDEPAVVARADVGRGVLRDDVRDLEQPEAVLDGLRLVRADRFEDADEETRAHDLEVLRRGIGEHDGRPGQQVAVGTEAQVVVVLVRPAEPVREDLAVPRARDLVPQKIAQRVEPVRLALRQRRRELLDDVVEAVRDGDVLDDVDGVQHVGPRARHGHDDRGVALERVESRGRELHLLAQSAHRIVGELGLGEADRRADDAELGGAFPRRHERRDDRPRF
mmetsp:Transcript_6136/g.25711  ORF Transcript_6136/g.25711 Transcript_6136/m.25711 type:complete len:356 (+) Transcript_6136:178-1245(+)